MLRYFRVEYHDFLVAVGFDVLKAQRVVERLVEIGFLNTTGEITPKLDLISMDLEWVELGPEFEDEKKGLMMTLGQLGVKMILFRFINTINSQIPRILMITDNMIKYGVSGGGVNKGVLLVA